MKMAHASLPCSLACFAGINFLTQTAFAQTPSPAEAETLPEVKVNADAETEPRSEDYRSQEMSLPKMPGKRLDTPQSTTVIPQALMRDQGVTTLRDALRDVSGLSIAAGEGGAQGDNLSLRGFSARSDIYQDGMRDFGSYNRDPFNLESVEVLKGPSSALFGRGSTGGVVNQVSKTPKSKDFADGTFAIGTDNTKRATADLNKNLADGVGFRLNLMDHYNQVTERDVIENRRFGVAPSLSFAIGKASKLSLSYLFQRENNIPDYGIPYLNFRRAKVERSNYYGFDAANYFKTNVDTLTLKFEHKLSDSLVLRNQFRNGYYERAFQITTARVPQGTLGTATPDQVTVTRNQITGQSKEESFDNDLSLSAKFETGSAKHQTILGVETIYDSSKPKRWTIAGVPSTNLARPDRSQLYTGTATPSSNNQTTARTVAAYVADSISFGEKFLLSAGLRHETIKAETHSYTPSSDVRFSRTDKALSYRGGLTYKPASWSSVYFNYGTSFQPSIEGLSLAANTKDLKPEQSETYELGSKSEFLNGALALEAALFRIEKTDARTPDKTDPTLNVLQGGQRVDGAEISLVGRPTPRVQVSSGYTHLIGKVTESNRAGEKNQTLTNTPKHSGNIWLSYLASERWDIGLGVFALSERFGSTVPDAATGNKSKVDGYVTTNAMAKYRLSEEMDVQLNLTNLGNVDYIDSVHPSHLVPAAGRTAILSTQFRI